MNRLFVLLFVLLFLVGCGQTEETVTVTAPIAPAGTATATPIPATNTTAPTTPADPTATSAPDQPPPTDAPPATATVPVPTATSAPVPATTIQLVPIADGFRRPTSLTHAFDDRLFVTEQAGQIYIIENGQRLDAPFLDLTDRAAAVANEQGLLSIAFHPQDPGTFFANYTDGNGDTIIARYRVSDDPNRADKGSEVVLLKIGQPYGNHNGGQLQFGPDGALYVGMGDGGSAGDPQGNGQDPSTLLGALLRLDVSATTGESGANYAIPPDNPYVGDDAGRNEVWAYGLRNPWRFSFDRLTGDLWVADVGQNQYEEVNVALASAPAGVPAPINYGWNIMEGTHCYETQNCDTEGLHLPVVEYDHSQGCSVTGGYVYRGSQFPALQGNYFYGDYCSGLIWSLVPQGDGWANNQVFDADFTVSSFGQDAAGELYVISHEGGIYQIQP